MSQDDKRVESKQTYRVRTKPGTHLGNSSETPGVKSGLMFDENNNLEGTVELVEAEPEVIVQREIEERIVVKKPSLLGDLARYAGSRLLDNLPGIVRDGKNALQEYNAAKAREERMANIALRRAEIEKERELARYRAQEKEAEERRQWEASLTENQRQVLNLSKALNDAYSGYQQEMTKEEACQKLINAFIGLMMFLTNIRDVKNGCIVDEETGELISGTEWIVSLPWGQFLQNVNILLQANPNWLKNYQALMLSEAIGRDVLVDGKYEPITAEEFGKCLVKIA